MANPQRGEIVRELGGQSVTLCLTLGALAEIEAVCPREERLTATRLLAVLAALVRGGGDAELAARLGELAIAPDAAAEAVAACFEAGTS